MHNTKKYTIKNKLQKYNHDKKTNCSLPNDLMLNVIMVVA